MSKIPKKRNPMMKLKEDPPPVPIVEEKPLAPLDEKRLFDTSKAIKIDISEKPSQELVRAPIEKKVKPVKKKRVLTEAHRQKLREGRLKGLETRRRKKKERQQKALDIVRGKEEKFVSRVSNKIDTEHERTLRHVQKIKKSTSFRQEKERQQYTTATQRPDPESEFKKFYGMMDRYNNIKIKQYQAKQKAQAPKAVTKPIVKKPSPKVRRRRRRVNQFVSKKGSESNFMNFFN